MPSILITCPVSKTKDYIFDLWLWHVATNLARPKGFDIEFFFSDNSNDGGQWLAEKQKKWAALLPHETLFWDRIHDADIKKCLPIGGKPNTRGLLMHSHNQCRDYMLAYGHDFMLHIECDIFPPADSLLKLAAHAHNGLKVVSGAYFHGYKEGSYLLVQHTEKEGEHRFAIPIGYGVSDMLYMDGHVKKVHSCGIGYTLIHKSILQKIQFRYKPHMDAHPDSFFYEDLELMGGQAWLDTSILCNHYNVKWDEVKF